MSQRTLTDEQYERYIAELRAMTPQDRLHWLGIAASSYGVAFAEKARADAEKPTE